MSNSQPLSESTTQDANHQEHLARLAVWLTKGVGPRMWQTLWTAFGSGREILAASPEAWRAIGIPERVARLLQQATLDSAFREEQGCQQRGVTLVWYDDSMYPERLRLIPDPPPVLYVAGTLVPDDTHAVAIVGSRHASEYGTKTAYTLAAGLTRAGFTIVSGLARGIDRAAHEGALGAGGRTLAVCAHGLAYVYPPEHAHLAQQIRQQGALLAEVPLQQPPLAGLFPQRNRLISGLALGVIVVEAARGSGALLTARHAVEQNRDVFAVPGRIDNPQSAGCHDLLRDGAILVRGVDDIIEALANSGLSQGAVVPTTHSESGVPARVVSKNKTEEHVARARNLNPDEETLYAVLTAEPISLDELVQRTGRDAAQVLLALTGLELRSLVKRWPGGRISRI
ncbi:MAG: DNA protecting protein DprA [Planctomycetaceae bacterium]|nr:MAG: DNA protecting protein DprA [Planctomycetaceae bacterium]